MAKDLLRQTRDYFKAQSIPEVDASILLEHLLKCTRSEVQLKLLRMSDDEINALDRELRRLVLRRQNGEPVQYITGTAPFRYLEYQADDSAHQTRPRPCASKPAPRRSVPTSRDHHRLAPGRN